MIGATKKQKEEKKKPDLFPNKKQKRVADYLGSQHAKTLKKSKGQTIDISQFPEYESLKGSNIFISVNDKGKVQSFNKMTSEQLAAQEERKVAITEAKKILDDKIKGRVRSRQKLSEAIDDPDPIIKNYNKLVDEYMTAKKKASDLASTRGLSEQAKKMLEKRVASKGRKLLDMADAVSMVTGGNEVDDVLNLINVDFSTAPERIKRDKKIETSMKKEEEMRKSGISGFSTKPRTQEEIGKTIPIEDVSTEELIKRLKL